MTLAFRPIGEVDGLDREIIDSGQPEPSAPPLPDEPPEPEPKPPQAVEQQPPPPQAEPQPMAAPQSAPAAPEKKYDEKKGPAKVEWKYASGVKHALIAVATLIAAPLAFSSFIQSAFWTSLALLSNSQPFLVFDISAVALGALVAVLLFLHDYYPKGAMNRFLIGIGAGACLIVYSFAVFVLSDLRNVLAAIGLQLDTLYVALIVTFASIIIMFEFMGEFLTVKKKLQEPKEEEQEEEGSEEE